MDRKVTVETLRGIRHGLILTYGTVIVGTLPEIQRF